MLFCEYHRILYIRDPFSKENHDSHQLPWVFASLAVSSGFGGENGILP
jgi:hypothetical protein